MSEVHSGKTVSKKTREKISESLKGNIPWNKNKKGVQIAWNKDKTMSKEYVEKTFNPNNSSLFKKGHLSVNKGKKRVYREDGSYYMGNV